MPVPARAALVRSLLLVALAGCAAGMAVAQNGKGAAKAGAAATPVNSLLPNNPAWSSLTPAQRTALAPLEREWPSIDTDRKEKWLEIAARFPKMPPDERTRVQARMTEWARLSPKERGEARLHYQEVRQLSPAERQARWEQYQALPPDQRRALAARGAAPEGAGRSGQAPRAASAAATPKSNMVAITPPPVGSARPVAPTVVQAKPGATTNLMSRPPAPPAHQQPGLPKVAATPGFVDKTTLLPQKGAQAAGTRAPAAAGSSASSKR
jgi:hypothetical protein